MNSIQSDEELTNCIKIDLHIHSCHSACGSLDMSPKNIINSLLINNIKIAAISDHNSIKNCQSFINYGQKKGICIFPAMEIQSEEEIHSIVIFPDMSKAILWQKWIEEIIPKIPLNPEIFGDEPVVDEEDNILELPEYLYSVSLPISFEDAENKAFEDNLIFFPAHINDSSFSIISQIGFIPNKHKFKFAEISKESDEVELSKMYNDIFFITNSDAHYLNQIGLRYNCIFSEKLRFFLNEFISTQISKDSPNKIEEIKIRIFNLLKDEVFMDNKNNSNLKMFFTKNS